MTDLGVINTNKEDYMEDPYKQIVHGHVWSRWVIHARYCSKGVIFSIVMTAKIFHIYFLSEMGSRHWVHMVYTPKKIFRPSYVL